jgi:hypothetical protein
MKVLKIRRKRLLEGGLGLFVLVVLLSSYLLRGESVVGRSEPEILEMALAKNDLVVAQEVYENDISLGTGSDLESVLGADINQEELEVRIYPEKRIRAEIGRLESLIDTYPAYPPLLLRLVKLYEMLGESEKVGEYENELVRLNVR